MQCTLLNRMVFFNIVFHLSQEPAVVNPRWANSWQSHYELRLPLFYPCPLCNSKMFPLHFSEILTPSSLIQILLGQMIDLPSLHSTALQPWCLLHRRPGRGPLRIIRLSIFIGSGCFPLLFRCYGPFFILFIVFSNFYRFSFALRHFWDVLGYEFLMGTLHRLISGHSNFTLCHPLHIHISNVIFIKSLNRIISWDPLASFCCPFSSSPQF